MDNEDSRKIFLAINKLADRLDRLEYRITALEDEKAELYENPRPAPPQPPASSRTADRNTADKESDEAPEAVSAENGNLPPRQPQAGKIPASPLKKDRAGSSLEERIGGRWFAKIGIVVLVLGVSFFLKYAFDNNWIGPTGRVIMGVAAGLALLALGERTIRKYFYYGQVVSGGGLAMLYLSVYAAFNFYALIGPVAAFVFMAIVTAAGIALSMRYNALSLIIFSTIGGFATPFLVPSGQDWMAALFSYIIILDLAVLFISFFRRWHWLNLIGWFGTMVVYIGWYDEFYRPEKLFPAFFFLTLFFLIYSLSALAYNLVHREKSTGIEQFISLLTGVIYFAAARAMLAADYSDFLGFFALLLAIFYFGAANLLRSLTPKDANMHGFLAFLSVGFIVLAVPLQFDQYLITLGWLVEAVLLFIIGVRIINSAKNRLLAQNGMTLALFGILIYGLCLFRTIFVDSAAYQTVHLLFLNPVFISGLAALLVGYFSAFIARHARPDLSAQEVEKGFSWDGKKLFACLFMTACLLTVFVVTRELIIYHEHQVKLERQAINAYNQEISQRYGNFSEYQRTPDREKISMFKERGQAAVALFWVVYGVILLSYGMHGRWRAMTALGAFLVGGILVKAFFHDIWRMDTTYRTIIALTTVTGVYITAYLYHLYAGLEKYTGEKRDAARVFAVMLIAVNIFTITWITNEIVRHYEEQKDVYRQQLTEQCAGLYKSVGRKFITHHPDGPECTNIRERLDALDNRSSIVVSVFWMAYAILLLVIGFARRYKWVRIGGIMLLMIAILKLFFYDLWSLGQLYRIIASISLGAVLLGISFLYHKFKHIFREMIDS